MEWVHDLVDHAATLIAAPYRCRVWYTTLGNWAAVIRYHGISTAAYNFPTPEEAPTECEPQVRGATTDPPEQAQQLPPRLRYRCRLCPQTAADAPTTPNAATVDHLWETPARIWLTITGSTPRCCSRST
jgi:hypothetical protein